jgi:predicted nucleic acid-binding protein
LAVWPHSCDGAYKLAIGLLIEWSEAFLLARTARKPVYDMFYLALARSEDAALITMDAALRSYAEAQGIRVA